MPKCFTDLFALKLTGHSTWLQLNNFRLDPILINNGTTQGDPDSMLDYGSYNVPLIEVAKPSDELSPSYIDDSMMLAVGENFADCYAKLKDMMERPGGGFDWSNTHNSPYKLSKITLMNFHRSHGEAPPANLILDKPDLDGTVSTSLIAAVNSYKYLGVIFNPALCWKLQHAKVQASATFWSLKIWCLSKTSSSLKPNDV